MGFLARARDTHRQFIDEDAQRGIADRIEALEAEVKALRKENVQLRIALKAILDRAEMTLYLRVKS